MCIVARMHESNRTLAYAIIDSGKKKTVIAKQARMRPSEISHLLHGGRKPTPPQAQRLAKVLGKTVQQLFPPDEFFA